MSVYTIFWLFLFGLIYFLPIGIAILIDNLGQSLEQTTQIYKDELANFGENKNNRNGLWRKKIWQKSWILVLANLVILVAYFIFHKNIWSLSWANFGLHFAGGITCSLIFEYFLAVFESRILIKLNLKLNFWNYFLIQLILLYFLVSSFGVGNELLEFLLDRIGNLPFSTDRFDTWFDLTANTLGSITAWFVLYFAKIVWNKFNKSL